MKLPDFEKMKRDNGPAGAPWVCVFGTSDPSDTPAVREAEVLGRALAEGGCVVVTGGYGAAMEAANRGARDAGGFSVGVTCTLFSREHNSYLDHVIPTGSLIERLETLMRLGDGYVAGKGGTGTLAEIALAWEYINKRIVPRRPLVLLGEFWSSLPGIIRDEKAAPGVSIGRASESILTARDAQEAAALVRSVLAEREKPKP